MQKIISVILILMSCKAVANDVVIVVTGRVAPMPCNVDTTQLNLDLGSIYASSLAKPGSSGPWVNGTLKLSNCPALTSGITASFSGKQGTYYYSNNGTAKNVELQLQTASGFDLSNGKSQAITITPDRKAELPLRVRAYSGNGRATDGTINGTINVTYTWQ